MVGKGRGENPPLQAGGGRQKGHSCVAHRIKKVPQSAAGLAPNASSYSNQSPFPQPNLQNFLASLSLPRCAITRRSFTFHPFWWHWGGWGVAAFQDQLSTTSQASQFQLTLRSRLQKCNIGVVHHVSQALFQKWLRTHISKARDPLLRRALKMLSPSENFPTGSRTEISAWELRNILVEWSDPGPSLAVALQ